VRTPSPAAPAVTVTTCLAWLALAAACLGPGAARADSLRCDGGLVSVGDTKLDLLGKCGRPALAEQRDVERGSALLTGRAEQVSQVATVRVETWTYNFGTRRFVQYVTLEAGRVVAVERGGYGYDLPGDDMGPAFIPRARCDHLSIHLGDRAFDLLARCGEPASRDLTVVRRQVVRREPAPAFPRGEVERREPGQREKQADRTRRAQALVQAVAGSVNVEVWAYDFGPQILVRLVELEDGVVTKVDTAGHGYSR
jgi:hypothetical protein